MEDAKEPNYDMMTDEEYYKEMERKVEHYKKHYPDMYKKAEQWLEMLDHSEVYKTHSEVQHKPGMQIMDGMQILDMSGNSVETEAHNQCMDLLKNMNFNGFTEEDLTDKEITLLNQTIPDWRTKLIKE